MGLCKVGIYIYIIWGLGRFMMVYVCVHIYGILMGQWKCHGMILHLNGVDMMFVCLKMVSMPSGNVSKGKG